MKRVWKFWGLLQFSPCADRHSATQQAASLRYAKVKIGALSTKNWSAAFTPLEPPQKLVAYECARRLED